MTHERARHLQLLDRLAAPDPPAYALLHRPEAAGRRVEILLGEMSAPHRLADLPLSEPGRVTGRPRHELLALVPYRQISERGFSCHDDGAPLLALTVTEQTVCPLDTALAHLPDTPISLAGAHFDIDDAAYAAIVRRVLAQEIGHGTGANFVIKRSFLAEVTDFSPRTALTLFRRLLTVERGAYWTFVVHTGDRTFVGATPERHVSLFDGTAVMNPISGTFRYPPAGPGLPDVMRFLADPKEAGELSMVVDEELKMMARIADRGGRIVGPFLKEMATLAHTEYLIEGRTSRDVRDILRETMFAPTVTGSPLESACRVIREYEPQGRGYYSGVAALVSRDINGGHSLDSAILLRTADLSGGSLRIAVGATLVRDSDPRSEVAETHAKAQGVLRALGVHGGSGAPAAAPAPHLAVHPDVRRVLQARNADLAPFWLDRSGQERSAFIRPESAGRRALIVDAEDTFTAMLAHQLRALGLDVEVRRFDEPYRTEGYDLVVMGPGPGDPRDRDHPRIARLRSTIRRLLACRTPFLAVCLSHQVLGLLLGFGLVRRERPNQGVQQDIDFFGRRVRLGFYNTFALTCDTDAVRCDGVPGTVAVSREQHTGQVHGLRGPAFRSLQFHAESVLSRDGMAVLGEAVTALLSGSPHSSAPVPVD
ncbi:anthranilate synthase family protein [Streptomyces sp. NPDC001922]|uniref:anthranilate synthase family protein n=1 Tax=Streptomyces sp. NPDC001922 TaxID=3364624 RepID=UPI003682F932